MKRNLKASTTKALARKTLACLAALATGLGPLPPAFGQRRGAEPEANADFRQQELGGPLPSAEPETGDSPEPLPASPAPAGRVQGVQIGTASSARPAPAAPTAPMERRIQIRVKDAPLSSFLDLITAQVPQVSFIIAEGLEAKKVTAFLQNVTVRDALQVLLETKGLTYQQIGKTNTYVVSPRSKAAENFITRIYALSHIPLISIQRGSGQQQQGRQVSEGGGAQKQETEAGRAIVSVIKSMGSGKGQVSLYPSMNALIITDIPEVFPQIEQIITELDKKAPQVMIEAQIVEINSNRSRELGFEWGGPNGELGSFTAGARDTQFPLNMPSKFNKVQFFDPVTNVVSGLGDSKGATGNPTQATDVTELAFGSNLYTSIINLTSLKVTLRALVSRSEARFLGKPKILTINNEPALIEVSQEEGVGFKNTQTSAGGSLGTQVSEADRKKTGLTLAVTPQVNKEGYITMFVQPSFINVRESNISSSANRVFDPVVRGASTLVRVRNNQTLVLGGLLQSNEQKVVRKVPVLGYIPILGWLFTSSSTRRANSDLVIFITPTIVSD